MSYFVHSPIAPSMLSSIYLSTFVEHVVSAELFAYIFLCTLHGAHEMASLSLLSSIGEKAETDLLSVVE